MEKIAIVCALKDLASVNIASQIKEIGLPKWTNFYEFDVDTVYLPLEKVDEKKVIVLSLHASKAGKKSLTAHSLGNFGKAELGGEEKMLVPALSKIQTNYVRAFSKIKKDNLLEDFDVCFEVTHHGPFTEKEVVFVEIGSSEKEWKNEDYGKFVAETIIEKTFEENNDKIVIGVGGGHYAPDFTKLTLRQNYSFGHICPQYALKDLTEELLGQMIKKSKAEQIILDWKGLKQEKERIIELCKSSGLVYERVQRLLK